MRTNEEMLLEIETANHGAGPDPVATHRGDHVREIIAGIEDRAGAQRRIDQAVVHARNDGASWTAIGAALGVSRQAALKRYGDCGRAPAKSAPR